MAIMDAKLILSDCQTACFSDGQTQTLSTNIIDLGAEDLDIGAGTPLYLSIRVGPVIDAPGAPLTGSVTFKLKTATGAAFNDTSSLVQKTILNSLITKGGQWMLRMPIPYVTKRYLRLIYVNSGSTGYTAMSFNSWISPAVPETNVGT